jgi:hypothetical protein
MDLINQCAPAMEFMAPFDGRPWRYVNAPLGETRAAKGAPLDSPPTIADPEESSAIPSKNPSPDGRPCSGVKVPSGATNAPYGPAVENPAMSPFPESLSATLYMTPLVDGKLLMGVT